MALKEGKCTNCGSMLMLDPAMPKGHCMFCDCVFDNSEAFRAFEHPEAFTFPNTPQPRYDGPSLDPIQFQRGPAVAAAPSASSVAKKEDHFVLPKKAIPDIRIPKKMFLSFVGAALAAAGIFCAVTFPLLARKTRESGAIRERFVGTLTQKIDPENNLVIHNLKSDSVILALPETITSEECARLFNAYCDIRADVLGIKDASFQATRRPVSFRVAMPDGGFMIQNPADEKALNDAVMKKTK